MMSENLGQKRKATAAPDSKPEQHSEWGIVVDTSGKQRVIASRYLPVDYRVGECGAIADLEESGDSPALKLRELYEIMRSKNGGNCDKRFVEGTSVHPEGMIIWVTNRDVSAGEEVTKKEGSASHLFSNDPKYRKMRKANFERERSEWRSEFIEKTILINKLFRETNLILANLQSQYAEEDAGARGRTGVSILHFRLRFGSATQGATPYPFTKIVLKLKPGTLYQDLKSMYCEALFDRTVSEGLRMLTADLQYLVVAYVDNWEYCENLMTRIMLDPPEVIDPYRAPERGPRTANSFDKVGTFVAGADGIIVSATLLDDSLGPTHPADGEYTTTHEEKDGEADKSAPEAAEEDDEDENGWRTSSSSRP
jgi:hypothetical protein